MNRTRIIPIILICFILLFISCSQSKTPETTDQTKSEDLGVRQINQDIAAQPKNIVPKPSAAPIKVKTPKDQRVAYFTTKLLDRHINRIHNIKRASRKINNYIIKPGETFSFNKVVGTRVYEKGYKKAVILVEGERVDDIGGGICQLSSTLYNAAEQLGLKIAERHTHSGDVHYIPIGQDAAVDYGNLDLKFINTKAYPIKLAVKIRKKSMTVSIYKTNLPSKSNKK